jgi:lipoprotein-releasing system permease protein
MKLPLFISRRYLFGKKSQNAINIISAISVLAVVVGTASLIVILSVFNGFDELIKSLFNSFDADLKITLVEGKSFSPTTQQYAAIRSTPGVIHIAEVLEENALLKYGDKQYIATVKGVNAEYQKVTGLDTMLTDGQFVLVRGKSNYAIVGQGIAYFLQIGLKFFDPIQLFAPRRDAQVSINPLDAFNSDVIMPSGIFSIEQESDSKYIIVPIEFARGLFGYTNEVTSLEIKLDKNCNPKQVKENLQRKLGSNYLIRDRYEQKETLYKIMKSEKWAIFFIFTFIIIIASFNIVGSLTILVIEKKTDIASLSSIGADSKLIIRIFTFEGLLITFLGAFIGLLIGLIICWVQIQFGLVKLQGSGSFIIDAYPVALHLSDFIWVFCTVMAIGWAIAYFPVRFVVRRYLFRQ